MNRQGVPAPRRGGKLRVSLGAHDRGEEPWFLVLPAEARQRLGLMGVKAFPVRLGPHAAPRRLALLSPGSGTEARGNPVLLPAAVERRGEELVLAPPVGILAATKEGFHQFYGHRPNFRGLLSVARGLGLPAFVFTPEDVEGERVRAHVYTGQAGGSWRRAVLPLPAAVYNRVPDRATERSPSVVRLKRRLEEEGIPLFNGGFFDKRLFWECLSRSPRTAQWLPRTEVLTERAQLERWLREERLIYLKLNEGRAGKGTIRVEAGPTGYRLVRYEEHAEGERQLERTFPSREQVVRALWKEVGERDYLMQRGIELATHEGRRFDVCLLLQKGRRGRWALTGMAASVGGAGHITTHYSWMGDAGHVLEEALGAARADVLTQRLRRMGLAVAEELERQLAPSLGRIGEMTLDVGIAKDGGVWFFEANSKPLVFPRRTLRVRSWVRSMRHCEALARAR